MTLTLYTAKDFINDSGYTTGKTGYKSFSLCPYYMCWMNVKYRCTSSTHIKNRPSYVGTSCVEGWLRFTNFKAWMEEQPYEGMHLDKDLIVAGNKLYGPETCCFVPIRLNSLLTNCTKKVNYGNTPLGVTRKKPAKWMVSEHSKPFAAQISGYGSLKRFRGTFATMEEAHKVWQEAKANSIEETVSWWASDPSVNNSFNTRVADSLLNRVWKLRLDAALGIETTEI